MLEKELELRIQSAFSIPEIGKDLYFINRRSEINWIKVVSADVKKIINEKECDILKENVLNILHYNLDAAVASKVLDPGFVKLFRLAQLTVEYLLHALNHIQRRSKLLSEEKILLRQELEKILKGRKEGMGDFGTHNSVNVSDSKRESHLVFVGSESSNIFRCMLCGKIFLNGCYLYAHHQRRHSQMGHPSLADIPHTTVDVSSKLPEKSSKIVEGEAEKIWKELEWLRKKVNEFVNVEKRSHQGISHSQPQVPDKSKYSQLQWTRSDQLTPEKSHDDAMPVRVMMRNGSESNCEDEIKDVREQGVKTLNLYNVEDSVSQEEREDELIIEKSVNMHAAVSNSNCVSNVRNNGEIVEEKWNDHQIQEVVIKEEDKEEAHFQQDLKNNHQAMVENAIRNKIEENDSNSLSENGTSSLQVGELQKSSAIEVAAKADDGRLEAQERVWKWRSKALEDKYLQQIEDLRKELTFHIEREKENEVYREKIRKMTLQLRTQSVRSTIDKAVGTVDEKFQEFDQAVPPIPSIAEEPESPPSSKDNTITSVSPEKQAESRESPFISPVSNESEGESRNSDVESDSSDVSTSPNVSRRMPSDHSSEDEESDPEMAIEVFEKKLRRLNINPAAGSMPEKVFKEKMEMLNAEKRLLKRKIEDYHHIRSNLEEKADARVSQKLLRLKPDKPKEESHASTSGYKSPKDTSNLDRMKDFPSSSSSKESTVATTSRSALSGTSLLPSARTVTSQSSIKSKSPESEDASTSQSRISVKAEKWKGSKGMSLLAAEFHSKSLERQAVPGVSTFHSSSGVGESHSHTSVGASILRGLHHTREGERASALPSLGGYGSKSVSFAHDLIGGKVYRAV